MPKHLRILTAALALGLAAVWLLSCSKKNPASPTPPPGELNGSLAAGGGQYAHKFNTAGSFNYHCSVHPSCGSLAGTIVVIAPGGTIMNHVLAITQSGGSPGDIYTSGTCSSISPQRDTVFVGDMVIWTNNSPLPHTVTSQ
ncbi:MAG TPA: hypothetical protein VI504_06610 [Candidatus Eisenbacteria bacterium]|jgi:plastocyanin